MTEKNETAFDTKVDSFAEKNISNAVWQYMISIKSVKKRDGVEQDFDNSKIQKSVEKALIVGREDDPVLGEKLTTETLSRLKRNFDGHSIPSTYDVRDTITTVFIDNNLTHVAKIFSDARFIAQIEAKKLPKYGNGLVFERLNSKEGVHPFDEIEWEVREAKITNEKGEIVFEQKNVEVPKTWSQTATNIVVSKYFRGKIGEGDRETSVKQLIGRVVKNISDWGRFDGYFNSAVDAQVYEEELTYLLVNQYASFNSPVWFNVGVSPHPQCSACFINSVRDDMRSILQLAMTEGMLFKFGSGTGSNLSSLRSSKEYLGGSNGKASGPVSFMRGYDAFAGVIKSGGKTRRAAKMVILNVDHPDIEDFITCKADEEKKAWALMDAGYDGAVDGEAYGSIFFQNANNSIRVTDEFMQAVESDKEWQTYTVKGHQPSEIFQAKDLMDKICASTWICGDPGMQYDTTVNKWHTCKASGRINGSNPCSEFMFLDDSACNLASLNLMKFQDDKGNFDVTTYKKAIEVITTAQDIIVGNSSYPTPAIEKNSHDYRPLGLGYANLGALLMSWGLPYDSNEGRNLAAALTSILTGQSYYQSTLIAEKLGPFAQYAENKESFMEVMGMHRAKALKINSVGVPDEILAEAKNVWDGVIISGEQNGFKNAQTTVLAPTGTIAFLMDCDTTGVEPDIALVKYKWLVGGGMVKIINGTVSLALKRLGYNNEQILDIVNYIEENDTIEGAPHLEDKHLPIFDCAFKAQNGERSIHYMGHIHMMSAVQPFLSGAISKTVNLPNTATEEDVEEVYMRGWKLGLKAVAVYRDGSKRTQPLTTSKESDQSGGTKTEKDYTPRRRPMPDERKAITHKFMIQSHKGYITVGLFDDGSPGEVFIKMAKEGSVISGLMDSLALSISIALQYGVPLRVLVNKFVHMRFEPAGFTNNPNIKIAKSIVDYVFRWLAMKFLNPEEQMAVGINGVSIPKTVEEADEVAVEEENSKKPQANLFEQASHTMTFDNQSDAPICDTCGSIMVRNGACYKCLNCGGTSGCS